MPSPIDHYLSDLPADQRAALERLHAILQSAIPGAEETIKTRVPALRYKGKTVVGFGAARHHVALYVMFGDALRVVRDELAGYDASDRVVRFAPDQPLPTALVQRIVRHRLAEIDAQTGVRGVSRPHAVPSSPTPSA
jgi:uncharacterized protein YdhG (YjbR/CyaY superfamily)